MKVLHLFFLLLLVASSSRAQDSLSMLTYKEYMSLVRDFHPTSKLAALSLDKGRAYLLKARGGFDAKIRTDVEQKYFDEKTYYSLVEGGFKIPTWYGLEINGGYERNRGEFLNEQSFLPPEGLVTLGIDVPLLRGLIIDQRRAQLKQAKLYQRATEYERLSILNTLFLESSLAYYDWQESYQRVEIYERGVQLADSLFQMVKGSFRNGASAAIDTVEAFIVLQNRQIELIGARQKLALSRLKASLYLWTEDQQPLELQNTIKPEAIIVPEIAENWARLRVQGRDLVMQHPELLFMDLNLAQQDVEVRLQKEFLKPDLRLKYNPLSDFSDDLLSNPVDFNDYKWGLAVDLPLLFRKERADYQLAQIEREKMQLKYSQLRQKYGVELDGLMASSELINEAVLIVENNVFNYRRLLQAEERKFGLGESSVFLINSRQNKYIEALDKRLKLIYDLVAVRLQGIGVFGQFPAIVVE